MVWGKIVGALVGFKLGGPLGALAGVVVGHWVDKRLSGKTRRGPAFGSQAAARAALRQSVFSTSVVNLAAKLAKADGVVTRVEVDAFKAQFNIPPSQMAAIGALYDEAKRDAGGFESHAQRLADVFAGEPMVRAEVLDALHRIALADGDLHPAEAAFLQTVAAIFGFAGRGFAHQAAGLGDEDPYTVLGVPSSASASEIKSAWRRLTREHHPDKLMAKGMPSEYIDLANKKMAAINAAYDTIRSRRRDL